MQIATTGRGLSAAGDNREQGNRSKRYREIDVNRQSSWIGKGGDVHGLLHWIGRGHRRL